MKNVGVTMNIVEDKQWKYMQTEAYAQEKADEIAEWYEKNKESYSGDWKRIEELLADNTVGARKELVDMLHMPDFVEKYKQHNKFAYFFVIMQIYESEKECGEEHTILDNADSYEELYHLILEVKFVLWRIEFLRTPEYDSQLYQLIQDKCISPYMLQSLIHISNADEQGMYWHLGSYFLENGHIRYCYHMLNVLKQLNPDNQEVAEVLEKLLVYINGYKSEGE